MLVLLLQFETTEIDAAVIAIRAYELGSSTRVFIEIDHRCLNVPGFSVGPSLFSKKHENATTTAADKAGRAARVAEAIKAIKKRSAKRKQLRQETLAESFRFQR